MSQTILFVMIVVTFLIRGIVFRANDLRIASEADKVDQDKLYDKNGYRKAGPSSFYIALPLLWVVLFLIYPCFFSFEPKNSRFNALISYYCDIASAFLTIPVFELLLLLLTPALRNRLSASSCADLWLVPCVLAGIIVHIFAFSFDRIAFLKVNMTVVLVILILWLFGVLVVFGWHILSHLRFRRQVLKGSAQPDDHTSQLFLQVQNGFEQKPQGRLILSDRVTAPLSIGLFPRTVLVVLPKTIHYSDEELRFIYTHELNHIYHADNAIKFYISFVTALGWFLPTQWIGMRKAAEDLELNCDQLSTKGYSDEEVRRYAALLLSGSSTDKGFTTCLSASAESMKYRLRRLLHPFGKESRLIESLMYGLCLLLFLSATYIAIAPGGKQLTQTVQDARSQPLLVVKMDAKDSRGMLMSYECRDSAGLLKELSDVRLYLIPNHRSGDSIPGGYGKYPFVQIHLEGGGWITIHFDQKHNRSYVFLTDTDSTYVTDRPIVMEQICSFIGEKTKP